MLSVGFLNSVLYVPMKTDFISCHDLSQTNGFISST